MNEADVDKMVCMSLTNVYALTNSNSLTTKFRFKQNIFQKKLYSSKTVSMKKLYIN